MQPYRIDEVLDIDVNGDRQNLHIRGTDPANPVVLFVHGGPGVCDRSWVMPKQSAHLADAFTLVCWDQRMAGKSFRLKNAKQPMSLEQVAEDLNQVVGYLCSRFSKKKIFLVGHSWGTILSCLFLPDHPEQVAAYVGMGQFVNGALNESMSYRFVWDYAEAHGDTKALADLKKIGEPVNGRYPKGIDDLMIQRNYMTKFGGGCWKEKENIYNSVLVPFLTSGEYRIIPDLFRYWKGTFHCLYQLWDHVVDLKFDETVRHLDVPVFLFQGDHDQNTPTSMAKAWFDALDAPYKEYVPFHESAHSPIKEEPELWGAALREKLLRLEAEAPTAL